MKKCIYCGEAIAEETKVCPKCKAAVNTENDTATEPVEKAQKKKKEG